MVRRSPVPEPRLVDNRHRVALPKEVRQALGIEPGEYVTFVEENGEIYVRKLRLTVELTQDGHECPPV